jgi:hypothetical protein
MYIICLFKFHLVSLKNYLTFLHIVYLVIAYGSAGFRPLNPVLCDVLFTRISSSCLHDVARSDRFL